MKIFIKIGRVLTKVKNSLATVIYALHHARKEVVTLTPAV